MAQPFFCSNLSYLSLMYRFVSLKGFMVFVCILFWPVLVQAGVKGAVVKIYTVFNPYNFHEPWQMMGQHSSHGSGCIIEGNRILTNAHVVSDQTFIQVRRAGKAKKYTAKVDIVGHESDLAILSVEDKAFFEGVSPVEIGELAEIKDRVVAYGFPEGGDILSITEGVVSRVEHTDYNHSGAYLLACQIDASINSGSSGGPVIKDDKIVGVAFQGMTGITFENIGYMVPVPVIRHFLEDIKDGRHDGTPEIGISMQKMENPGLRKKYGMAEKQTGALVNKVYPDSPAKGIIFPDDVILSIDGEAVENDGTVEFRKGERTFLGYVAQKKQINDSARFRILRGKKIVEADVLLSRSIGIQRLVPNRSYESPPTYYICGGLVFEPLSLNYLMEYGVGGEWSINAPTGLVNYYINGEPTEKQREIVVLVKVLADEINVGYHSFEDAIISRVNGKKITRIKDLVEAFEENRNEYHIIEDIKGYKIILDRESVDKNSQRILKKYKMPADRSRDLLF